MKKSFIPIISFGCFCFLYFFSFPMYVFGQTENQSEEITPADEKNLEIPPEEPQGQQPQTADSPAPEVYQQEAAEKTAPQNTISLDLKGLDIVDVLKMISARSGMNIVVGKNVTGRVTIFLKDVNLWDAFEIILSANNLAYEKKDTIIYVMTDRDYEFINGDKFADKKQLLTRTLRYAKAQDVSNTLNQIKSSIGRVIIDEATNTIVVLDTPLKVGQMGSIIDSLDKKTETRVFELKYAQAEKLSPKIQESLSKGVGSMKIDERTNKIAITDYPNKLAEIAKIFEAFDEKTMQVRIDAQIIEIKPTDEFKMGVDWDAWIDKNFRFISPLGMGGTSTLSLGLAAGKLAVSEKFDKKGTIDLLRTIGETNVLSSPSIMVLNNQEAKILVGTKQAYITSTTSQGGTGTEVTSQTVNFVDVGIKFYVTPTINKDGFITMKIKPEVSSAEVKSINSEGKSTDVPIVSTSEAETTVVVKDGATIIIAGLKKNEKIDQIKKIPLLGDIPLLGVPFRSVSHTVNKTELVIFLTPRITTDDNIPKYTNLSGKEYGQKTALRVSERKQEVLKKQPAVKLKPSQRAPAEDENLKTQSSPKDIELVTSLKDYGEHIRSKILSIVKVSNDNLQLKGEALVSFTLSERGELNGEPEIVFLTSEDLREPTLNAVRSAGPFAQFPNDLQKPQERFSLTVVYN